MTDASELTTQDGQSRAKRRGAVCSQFPSQASSAACAQPMCAQAVGKKLGWGWQRAVTATAKLTRAAPIQPLLLGSCFGTCDSDSGINFPNLSQQPCQQTTSHFSSQLGFNSLREGHRVWQVRAQQRGSPTKLQITARYSQTTAAFWGRQIFIFPDISRANQGSKSKFDYCSLKLKMQYFSHIQLLAAPNSNSYILFPDFKTKIKRLKPSLSRSLKAFLQGQCFQFLF